MAKFSSKEIIDKSSVCEQVIEFVHLFLVEWWNTDKEFPKLDERKKYWYRRKKEKETDIFIGKFIEEIRKFPCDEIKRKKWKEHIVLLIDDFIMKSDLISFKDKKILLSQGMLENTEKFINEVRKFNADMLEEDIGQALRNLWIMNIIQLLLGKKIELTPSVFAYSMLYPYTDNYLDDINITKEEKRQISDRLELRLSGKDIKPNNSYEESIFKLVSMIESEFERLSFLRVFESLVCIHRAQKKSLLAQEKKSGPYEVDILGISIEKGGSSVLTDAYLVNGTLKENEAAFFFGYGVLLQMCDDLQDVMDDTENDHMTIISQVSNKWPLDKITNGLINFTFNLIDNADCFNCKNIVDIKKLIRKNCLMLIFFAIAKNKRLYSRRYFKEIQQYFPYRTHYMTSFYKRLRKKFSKVEKNYGGVPTEKIVIFALS